MFKSPPSLSIFYLLIMLFISCKSNKESIDIKWLVCGKLPTANNTTALGVAGPVSGISDGKLIIGGGANFPNGYPWEKGVKQYHDDVYVFNMTGDSCSPVAATHQLPYPLAYAATAQSSTGIIYGGGENADGISNKVFSLTYRNNGLQVDSLPFLPEALTNASMTFYNNRLYFVGGENASATSACFWYYRFDEPAAGWQSLPPLPYPVSHSVQMILSVKGKDYLYLFGGRCKNADGISTIHNGVYAFDFSSNEWHLKKALPHPLGAGTGVNLNNNAVLIGGDNGIVFNKIEALIARASKLQGGEKEKVLQEKNDLQRVHSGFTRNVLLYDPQKDEWSFCSALPFAAPVTTTAVLHNNEIYITSGEVTPGIRTPDIIKGKILTDQNAE